MIIDFTKLDYSHLPPHDLRELEQKIKGTIEDAIKAHDKKIRGEAILKSDDLFAKEFGSRPIVRAKTYRERGAVAVPGYVQDSDGNGPVFMKGISRSKYSSYYADAYEAAVIKRYLIMKKYTEFDRGKVFSYVNNLANKMGMTGRTKREEITFDRGYYRDEFCAYVDGVIVRFPDKPAYKQAENLFNKMKKLERLENA